jgi:hypothetical protein
LTDGGVFAGLAANEALAELSDSGALSGLHDIVVPEPVSYLPQTIGWGIVLLALIGLGVWLGVLARRRQRTRRYRELALRDLEALRRQYQGGARQEVFSALPELVKRTALVAFPRPDVASLTGKEWLEFLNRSYDGAGFTDGPGRWLPSLAYACRAGQPVPDEEEMGSLVSLVQTWIRDHRQREAVETTPGGDG